jgi:hypothetical protein
MKKTKFKKKAISSQSMNDMSIYIYNEHKIKNKKANNDLLTYNTIQDNISSTNDKHTKIDNVIENDELNTYEKYIKNYIHILKIL